MLAGTYQLSGMLSPPNLSWMVLSGKAKGTVTVYFPKQPTGMSQPPCIYHWENAGRQGHCLKLYIWRRLEPELKSLAPVTGPMSHPTHCPLCKNRLPRAKPYSDCIRFLELPSVWQDSLNSSLKDLKCQTRLSVAFEEKQVWRQLDQTSVKCSAWELFSSAKRLELRSGQGW